MSSSVNIPTAVSKTLTKLESLRQHVLKENLSKQSLCTPKKGGISSLSQGVEPVRRKRKRDEEAEPKIYVLTKV